MRAGPCVIDRLSAFLDGDLPAIEAQVVRAHLEGCASCARAAAEIGAVVQAARSLDRPEPPPTLWPAIEGRLDALDGLGTPQVGGWGAARRGWRALWRPFGVGVLAGAAVAAVLAFAVGGARNRTPATPVAPPMLAGGPAVDPLLEEAEAEFARAAAAYERSIEKLRVLLSREEVHWSNQERARHAERLARLDDAITRSREIARRTGDSAGNEQLFAAYQQKIAFLTAAVHRGRARGEEGP